MQESYSLRKPIIENKKSKRRELGKLATNKRSFRTLCKFTAWNKFHLIGRAGVYVTNRRVNHSPPRLPLNFSLNSWSPRSKQLQSFPNYSINDGTLPKFGVGAWFGRKFETGRAQRPRVPRFSPLTRQIWHAQLCHSCLCGVCGGFKGRITARPSRENCSAWTVAENKRAKRNHSPFPTPPFSLLLFYSRAIDARLFFATGKILRGNNRPRFRAFVAGNWFISAFLRVSPSSFYFRRLVLGCCKWLKKERFDDMIERFIDFLSTWVSSNEFLFFVSFFW